MIKRPESCKVPMHLLLSSLAAKLHQITILQLKWRSMVSQKIMIEPYLLYGFHSVALAFEYGLKGCIGSDLIVAQSDLDKIGL